MSVLCCITANEQTHSWSPSLVLFVNRKPFGHCIFDGDFVWQFVVVVTTLLLLLLLQFGIEFVVFSSCVCLLSCWFGHNTVRVLVLCRHRARPTKNSIELNWTELNEEHRCSIFSLRRRHRVRHTHSKRHALYTLYASTAEHSSICSQNRLPNVYFGTAVCGVEWSAHCVCAVDLQHLPLYIEWMQCNRIA